MTRFALVALLMFGLNGCGTTAEDRGISGAGIGASAGAVVGAITGLSVLEGAAIGAAAGAITGLLTDERQINFGKPAWKQNSSSGAAATAASANAGYDRGTVRDVQNGLARLGYNPGPVDGVLGPRTGDAIRSYQRDHGLLVDGKPTSELAAHINRISSS